MRSFYLVISLVLVFSTSCSRSCGRNERRLSRADSQWPAQVDGNTIRVDGRYVPGKEAQVLSDCKEIDGLILRKESDGSFVLPISPDARDFCEVNLISTEPVRWKTYAE